MPVSMSSRLSSPPQRKSTQCTGAASRHAATGSRDSVPLRETAGAAECGRCVWLLLR
jgi:hypothetical protein